MARGLSLREKFFALQNSLESPRECQQKVSSLMAGKTAPKSDTPFHPEGRIDRSRALFMSPVGTQFTVSVKVVDAEVLAGSFPCPLTVKV
jgi:hypothetical protein